MTSHTHLTAGFTRNAASPISLSISIIIGSVIMSAPMPHSNAFISSESLGSAPSEILCSVFTFLVFTVPAEVIMTIAKL